MMGLAGMATPSRSAEEPKRVYIIPIREDKITPQLLYLVRRGVKEAMAAKADLLVLDMNTYGGELITTMEIVDCLNEFKGDTATYISNNAYSAGALISFATRRIYMSPQAVIGAAAPVQEAPGGAGIQELQGTVKTKLISAMSAKIRAAAEKNGHNKLLVNAMIDETAELKIDDKVINEKGHLLSLTCNEASENYGVPPKPLLSAGTMTSMNELLDKAGYSGASIKYIEPTGAETIGTWLMAISPFLLIIGIVGVYVEIKMPGTVIPAVIAVIAFLLYFLGGYVAGLSGMEWALVFIVGLALLISELFVHPGTILPGLLGMVLIFVALVMAMADIYPGGPTLPTLPQVEIPLTKIIVALGASMLIMLALAKILPRTPIYRSLVSQSASGVTTIAAQEQEQKTQMGHKGVAISNLRPGGKAQFGNDILDVITEGEMIAKGSAVRIIGHSGREAIVEIAA